MIIYIIVPWLNIFKICYEQYIMLYRVSLYCWS